MTKTYLFYDIETTGLNKCFDQIVQFAAIRTDLALNELERHEFFIKLRKDVIPSPHAFITHRITLSQLADGLDEYSALKKIHLLFNTPGTISIGYNSLGFDDEFLRFSFYRNLLPPYTHQYANECSRMDLYPMAVAYYLFKNDLITWPSSDLKLESIAKANNFLIGQAHNAMSDVMATVELAKRFQQDRTIWDYLCGFFYKEIDTTRCQTINNDPNQLAILIDGKFGIAQHYQSAAMHLGQHQHYRNQTLWLRLDQSNLQEITHDNFIDKTWVINKKLGEPSFVLPMKERFMKPYLQDSRTEIVQIAQQLRANTELLQAIKQHYRNFTYPVLEDCDVAAKLYQVGFMSQEDEQICKRFHQAKNNDRLSIINYFNAEHLQQLAARIVWQEDESLLQEGLREELSQWCETIIQGQNTRVDYTGKRRYTCQEALQHIEELTQSALEHQQQVVLAELNNYLKNQLNLITP